MEIPGYFLRSSKTSYLSNQDSTMDQAIGETHEGKPPISPSKITTDAHEMTAEQRAFQTFQRCCPDLTSEDAAEIFQRLRSMQLTLEPTVLELFDASDTCPYTFSVTEKTIQVHGKIAGKGASTTVYFTTQIGTVHGTPEKPKVLKRSKKPFDREQQALEQLSPTSQKKGERGSFLDHPDGYFSNDTEFFVIGDPSKCNLSEVDYKNIEEPVSYIVPRLKAYMEGVGALHRQEIVHRDIKGANLLVSPAKVTDFGLAMRQSVDEKSRTAVSPFYAAPFIWRNVVDQANRQGKQTVESDIFSFGRTLQYDVLLKMLKQLSEKYKVSMKPIINRMHPRRLEDDFTDKRLLSLEAENPGLVICEGRTKSGKRSILTFPKREYLYSETMKAIGLLETYLSSKETLGLKRLADLAKELQNNDPSELPSYKEVIGQLDHLFSPAKKRLFSDIEDCNDEVSINENEREAGAIAAITQMMTRTASVNIDEGSSSSHSLKRRRTNLSRYLEQN